MSGPRWVVQVLYALGWYTHSAHTSARSAYAQAEALRRSGAVVEVGRVDGPIALPDSTPIPF